MNISFTKTEGWYMSEFEATSDFNLHIERSNGTGRINMYQRTASSGEFAQVDAFDEKMIYNPVIDTDCSGMVYPKTIRIVSEVEPTYAEVTFRG